MWAFISMLMFLITCAATAVPCTASSALGSNGSLADGCALYNSEGDCGNSCAVSCGQCKNAGAREGVFCNGQGGQTGYYCPPDANGGQGDVTFACMDWTFGSKAMQAAEAQFNMRAGENVYLGVGAYGTGSDVQRGLGACYRLTVEGVDRDIIAQSLNTGHDVVGNQFDLQIGAGGAGAYNTCAGADWAMYPGSRSPWGCVYGGVDSRAACDALPAYPRDSAAMKRAGDSLIALCKYGWDKNVRMSGTGMPAGECKYNPTLLDVARVQCPEELVNLTQMQRLDEPDGYLPTPGSRPKGFPNRHKAHECRTHEGGRGTDYCLTRMMDCRKPSGAFVDNVQRFNLMAKGLKVAQTCTKDGYTRINVQCGCVGCCC